MAYFVSFDHEPALMLTCSVHVLVCASWLVMVVALPAIYHLPVCASRLVMVVACPAVLCTMSQCVLLGYRLVMVVT